MAQLDSTLDCFELGPIAYLEALDLQQRLHAEVRDKKRFGAVLLLQHKPVLTLGKNADPKLILHDHQTLHKMGVEVVLADRGGEVTAHELGQLVVYPILPLHVLKLPPKLYVDRLLQAVMLTLKQYGIASSLHPDYPGVWIGNDKICAIGIRVKERVSLHGIALNVSNSMELFRMIVPCGIRDRDVTSMHSLLGSKPDLSDVARVWLLKFSEVMDLTVNMQSAESILS